jgi:hypothetical protein
MTSLIGVPVAAAALMGAGLLLLPDSGPNAAAAAQGWQPHRQWPVTAAPSPSRMPAAEDPVLNLRAERCNTITVAVVPSGDLPGVGRWCRISC